jgi:hypothetical protein
MCRSDLPRGNHLTDPDTRAAALLGRCLKPTFMTGSGLFCKKRLRKKQSLALAKEA